MSRLPGPEFPARARLEVVEGQEHIAVFHETFTGSGILGLVFFQAGVAGLGSVRAGLGSPDLMDVILGPCMFLIPGNVILEQAVACPQILYQLL